MQITSSAVVQQAQAAGLQVREVTMGLTVIGVEIGSSVVRHDGTGWYKAPDVRAAIVAGAQGA